MQNTIAKLKKDFFNNAEEKLQYMLIDHVYECVRKYEYYKDISVNYHFTSGIMTEENWKEKTEYEYLKEWIDLFIISSMLCSNDEISVQIPNDEYYQTLRCYVKMKRYEISDRVNTVCYEFRNEICKLIKIKGLEDLFEKRIKKFYSKNKK